MATRKKKRPFTQKGHPWQPTDDQLWCRDVQHSWAPYTAHREKGGFVRTLICTRCAAEKYQHLDESGYIMSTRMSYPLGYLRPGEGRLTREERAELRVRNIS